MFKKKCPSCGAKNDKERMVCIECSAPLASEQVKRQLSQVSTEGEAQVRTEVEKAAKERVEDEYRGDEKVVYKAMGPTAHKKSAWFWVGVVLLSISALWWLLIILVPGDIGDTILAGVVTTIVPIGIGVYCVRRGRKALSGHMDRSPKPSYNASQPTVMPTQKTQQSAEPAYRPEPTAKPRSSTDRYAVQDTKKVLYRTRCELSLPHNKPEEADCIVTENHVVIEAGEPIEIPLPRVIGCQVDATIPDFSSYRPYSTQTQESISGTATLTFLDDQNSKHELLLKGHAGHLLGFKRVIDRQIVGRFVGIDEEYRRKETSGEFLSGAKETFRDHTRDDICASLQRLGIDAQMAPRGRPEEEVWGKGSLGIIHIPEGPIRWVNVRKETQSSGQGSSTTYYYTEYGVPDPRLGPDSPGARIETVRVRTFPLFGRVVDLRWKGSDSDLGIINRLNSDNQLKQPIMKSRDVSIRSIRDYGCWIISTVRTHGITSIGTRYVVLEEQWSCYQAIARHLLAEWSSISKFDQAD